MFLKATSSRMCSHQHLQPYQNGFKQAVPPPTRNSYGLCQHLHTNTKKRQTHMHLFCTAHQLASSAICCSRLQVYARATDASLLRRITRFYVMLTCSHALSLCQKKNNQKTKTGLKMNKRKRTNKQQLKFLLLNSSLTC